MKILIYKTAKIIYNNDPYAAMYNIACELLFAAKVRIIIDFIRTAQSNISCKQEKLEYLVLYS